MKIKKILVSQPKPASDKSPYFELAEKFGVEIVFRPFIKVEGLSAREFRAQKISIPEHTAIIFTAKTAIDHFFRLCDENRYTVPDTQKYFCTSETIGKYLQKYIVYRKRKIFNSPTGKIDGLIPFLTKHKNEKFLLALSETGSNAEADALNGVIAFDRAAMYRTVSNDFAPDEPFDYDMLVFFSPAGIDSLFKNFPDFKQENIVIATFGPTTTKDARDAGLNVQIEAPAPDAPSMPAAIGNFLSAHQERADEGAPTV